MTDADFALVEKNLRIRLPDDYKTVFTDYPGQGQTVFDELLNDYYAVLQANTLARQYAHLELGDDLEEVPWPPHYFVIGHDAFGNAYFLDLNRAPSPVFFQDHETSEVKDVCAQVKKFVPYLLQLHKGDAPSAR